MPGIGDHDGRIPHAAAGDREMDQGMRLRFGWWFERPPEAIGYNLATKSPETSFSSKSATLQLVVPAREKKSWRADSNRGPADYESAALPTELRQRLIIHANVILRIQDDKIFEANLVTLAFVRHSPCCTANCSIPRAHSQTCRMSPHARGALRVGRCRHRCRLDILWSKMQGGRRGVVGSLAQHTSGPPVGFSR
jgi:hypothetical protein